LWRISSRNDQSVEQVSGGTCSREHASRIPVRADLETGGATSFEAIETRPPISPDHPTGFPTSLYDWRETMSQQYQSAV